MTECCCKLFIYQDYALLKRQIENSQQLVSGFVDKASAPWNEMAFLETSLTRNLQPNKV